MKTLNLEFKTEDLHLKPEGEAGVPTSIELSKRIIIFVIREYCAQVHNVLKPERKQARWLYDELEKAAATELKTIELPDDICGFLRKVFRETRLPAMDPTVDRIEKNIDDIKMD